MNLDPGRMSAVQVICLDRGADEKTHKGHTVKIATFERHEGRWFMKVPPVDITSGRDQLGRITLGPDQGWREDRGLAMAGAAPLSQPRFDGYGDDIAGKRFTLPCRMCRRNETIRGVNLASVLGVLADARVETITLASLAARLSGAR